MAQVTATIASKVGLHARPAATFVKAVAEKGVPVTIAKEGGAPVDASSILGVMTLGAGFGDVVTLASDADGADGALGELKALLETDLDAYEPSPSVPLACRPAVDRFPSVALTTLLDLRLRHAGDVLVA